MEISVIASGSNGNCCLVEDKGVSVLIDAGKSRKELEKRMNALGKSLENVDACVISHSHSDHVCGAGVISRRYNIPLYVNPECAYPGRAFTGKFKIKCLEIKPVLTSHNVPSSGFVIGKFGLFTDTGMVTPQMESVMKNLNAVLLESNHDVDMLRNGRYPHFLKNWILSDKGHLSNETASSLVQKKGSNLSLVLLGHLSGNNNTPMLAGECFETLVKRKIDYSICSREGVSGSWRV